jgi:hypothetical protein
MDEKEFLIALKQLKDKFPSLYRHLVGIIKSVLMI